ncbi:uncharacterized protein LOC141620930 [Silene latifolia]|uniref:uncharacterized protein LOC141620930 n=1 Tax=Silene latifolia TaxID=37657 RepID=UPI003D76F3E0
MEVVKGVDYRESSDYDGEISGNRCRKRDSSDDSSRSTEKRKLNKITWHGATFYSYMTYEEYAANQKEIDEFLLHPPGWDDPNTYKEQSAEICQECFLIIQKKFPEMSDYELVEPLYTSVFNGSRIFAHLNFKAKQKGAADSSTSAYFVEYDMIDQDISCFRETTLLQHLKTEKPSLFGLPILASKSTVFKFKDYTVRLHPN